MEMKLDTIIFHNVKVKFLLWTYEAVGTLLVL